MKKKIITLLLFILAMIMCFPIVFLLSGSIMGAAEIKEYLGPVLNDGADMLLGVYYQSMLL